MGIRVIALQLDDKLCRTLEEVAAHLRLGAIENALRIAAAEWVRGARPKSTMMVSTLAL